MRKRSNKNNKMYKMSIPDRDKAGLYFIKHYVKVCPDSKLIGIQQIVNESKNPEIQSKLQSFLDKQYVKRNIQRV